MARWGISLIIAAALPFLIAAASGKVITVRGKVTLDNGQVAPEVEVIIKDSWAGFLAMREREIMRVMTNAKGEFFVEGLRYQHTLDLLVVGKRCRWLAANGRVRPEDRGSDGVYNVNIVLLSSDCASSLNPPRAE